MNTTGKEIKNWPTEEDINNEINRQSKLISGKAEDIYDWLLKYHCTDFSFTRKQYSFDEVKAILTDYNSAIKSQLQEPAEGYWDSSHHYTPPEQPVKSAEEDETESWQYKCLRMQEVIDKLKSELAALKSSSLKEEKIYPDTSIAELRRDRDEALKLADDCYDEIQRLKSSSFSREDMDAIKEIIKISDRKHPAWDRIKLLLK